MMEKLQEKKWVCKWCNKVFFSWYALGGHMYLHSSTRAAKAKRKLSDIQANECSSHDGEENSTKKIKTEKFTGSETTSAVTATSSRNVCVVCGKEFWSVKAVHGHMRNHSVKEREYAKCKRNDKGIETLGDGGVQSRTDDVLKETEEGLMNIQLSGGRYNGEDTGCLTTGKMSIKASSISPSAVELNQEEFEVAEILMMLSLNVKIWGSSNGAAGKELSAPVSNTTRILGSVKAEDGCSKSELAELDVPQMGQKLCHISPSACSDSKMLCKKTTEYKCRSCGKLFNCYKALGGHCSGHARYDTHFRSSYNRM